MSPTKTSRRKDLQALEPPARFKCTPSLRRCLCVDIESSSYWSHLAPTVAFVPDFLVVAWAEICNIHDDEALGSWSDFLHDWPCRPLRYINNAGDFVREYISFETTGHLRVKVSHD